MECDWLDLLYRDDIVSMPGRQSPATTPDYSLLQTIHALSSEDDGGLPNLV